MHVYAGQYNPIKHVLFFPETETKTPFQTGHIVWEQSVPAFTTCTIHKLINALATGVSSWSSSNSGHIVWVQGIPAPTTCTNSLTH